jgi:pilus assembly protein CpaB
MAQTMSTAGVGRVNRRFLLLALILATLSAVLVYAAISNSGGGGGTASGDDISVVVAKAAIPAGTELTADLLELRAVPENVVGTDPFQTVDALVGQVVRYPIAANEPILLSNVAGGLEIVDNNVLSYIIEAGKRGMAIKVEAVVGAGGLVLPGDKVDIYWAPEETLGEDAVGAGLIAENIEVLAVQQTLVDLPPTAPGAAADGEEATTGGERLRGSDAEPIPDAATVTLLLTSEEAARVFCADAGEGEIRLAVRALGDDSPTGLPIGECIIEAKEEDPASAAAN